MSGRYGLEIRAAVAADAPDLTALLAGAGLDVPVRELAERLATLRQHPGAVLVAVAWGPPSGVIALHWFRSLTAAAPAGSVDLLLVDPGERRRGIGRILLKAASQAARQAGCTTLRIEVAPGRADLRGFCAATGFAAREDRGEGWERPLRRRG